MKKKLESLTLGKVELNVRDIKNMSHFYNQVMGLDVIKESSQSVELGKNKTPIISLHHTQNFDYPEPKESGLYHFAILFSSRGDLARTVQHIIKKMPVLFTGSSDHLVSEAFYFNDPEGNGIELYYDRDRSSWQWEKGMVKMATMFLDPAEYILRYVVVEEKNTDAQIGHIHLKVGNIKQARKFYVDILGFTVTAELPEALFVSIGGYHHHIGLNTWESAKSEERKETLGLRNYTFHISNKDEVDELKENLKKNKIIFKEDKHSVYFFDPWKNQIRVILNSV